MRNIVRSALLFCLLAPLTGAAQEQAKDQGCNVKITVPSAGDRVEENNQVYGTGNIPADTHLWVLAHRKGLALWWPQGAGPAEITQGKWEVAATFGVARDSGHEFEIAAAVVDNTTNQKLLAWVSKTNETGQYPGMDFPSTVDACKLQVITVTKR